MLNLVVRKETVRLEDVNLETVNFFGFYCVIILEWTVQKPLNIIYTYVKQDISFSVVICTIYRFFSHVLINICLSIARK
jgi:hypothetical protein